MATPIRETPTLHGKDTEKFLRQVSKNLKKDHSKAFEQAAEVYGRWTKKTGTSVDFEYSLRDNVILLEINTKGLIDGMLVDSLGKTYRVTYWYGGSRCSCWVYASEIKLATGDKK